MANQVLYGGFRRLGSFPLDASSVIKSTEELKNYLLYSASAYEGQVIVVTNDPDPTLNGAYTIHFEEKIGANNEIIREFVPRHSATIEQVLEEIGKETENIKTSIINPITEKVNTINTILGINDDSTTASESLLNRLEKIEEVLELSDPDTSKHILDEITKALEDVQKQLEEGIVSDKYVEIGVFNQLSSDLNETKTELSTTKSLLANAQLEIIELKRIINLIDDGKINDSLENVKELITNLEELDTRVGALYTELLESVQKISSFENSIAIVAQNIERTNSRIDEIIREGTGTIDKKISESESKTAATINAAKTELNTKISTNANSIKTLETTVGSVSDKVSEIENKVDELTENTGSISKMIVRSFSSDSSVDVKLPNNIILSQVRVVINTAGSRDDITGYINIDNKNIISKNEIYLDEKAQYCIETFEAIDGVEHHLKFIAINSSEQVVSNFGGAVGKLFIEYYDNKQNN